MKVTEFFNTDFVSYGSYDNLRKIASYVDGLKNASRKVVYTVLEKNIKDEVKVSQLNSKVAEFSDYLHGDISGVIVNMAQNFIGTNNIPLLMREGNFGTRFSQQASAPRYIYTFGNDSFFKLFSKEDTPVLVNQYFEGAKIEPRFYVPLLPILLINGSEGVSSGFAQKILNRNPKKVKQYILDYLSNSLRPRQENSLEPYYQGFKGTISQGENEFQWIIKGCIARDPKGNGKVTITELPVGYDLKDYIDVLDTLEEKKIIQGYKDNSENDEFNFVVSFNSKVLKEMTDDEVLLKLKLVKRVSENFTCMDENNKIREFESAKAIIGAFINIKLEYLDKRKAYKIKKMEEGLSVLKSKYFFIKGILDGSIEVNNKTKAEIISQLEKPENVKNIQKYNDSWEFLLNLRIYDLTEEKFFDLKEELKTKKIQYDEYKAKDIRIIYKEELEDFKI